jgi:class 3 adenylate cyclase/tetratricopeptide (TPR) repeat protein
MMKNLLPHFIADQFRRGARAGTFPAITLHADISGFTPMTEELMQNGPDGAEVLTTILNDLFGPMVRVVYEYGGFISTFAGDALTAIFPCSAEWDGEGPALAAASGLTSANQIQQIFTRRGVQRTSLGSFSFAVKVGVGYGEVEWGIVGDERSAYYFRGSSIAAAVAAEHRAERGTTVVDGGLDSIVPADGNGRDDAHLAGQRRSRLTKEIARRFLPDSILNASPKGEFRDAVSVFLSFDGTTDPNELDRLATLVLAAAEQRGGYVKEIDFAEGCVIPCFFGIPKSYGDSIGRALDFALALRSSIGALPAPPAFRAGISFGQVFAGIAGSSQRSHYSIVGSEVNFAARLMTSAAWGEILVGEKIARHPHFHAERIGERSFKGFPQPIETFVLLGRLEQSERSFSEHMIGRQAQLEMLRSLAAPILDRRPAGIVYIRGEAGIGKSRLAFALRQSIARGEGVAWFTCTANAILPRPFEPFVTFLKRYFSQSDDATIEENRTAFKQALANLRERFDRCTDAPRLSALKSSARDIEQAEPILSALLGLDVEHGFFEQLDARARYDSTIFALGSLFVAESLLRPVVLFLEDLHAFDKESLDAVKGIVRRAASVPMLAVATVRYDEHGTDVRIDAGSDVAQSDIHLHTLTGEEVRQLAAHRLGGQPHDSLLVTLLEKTRGNPYFVQEMLAYMSEHELLCTGEDGWRLKSEAASRLLLPDSLNALLTTRIDRLEASVKEVVKAASTVGLQFELPLLAAMLDADVEHDVKRAEGENIWEMVDERTYAFKHALLRDAAYQMQMVGGRRHLHRRAASAMEALYGDRLARHSAEVAYHYERAEMPDKAVEFYRQAIAFAEEQYQNRQVVELCNRLLSQLGGKGQSVLRAETKLSLSSAFQTLGDHDAAKSSCSDTLEIGREQGNSALIAKALRRLGMLHHSRAENVEALNCFNESQALFEKLGDRAGVAKVIGNIGIVHLDRSELAEALKCFEEQRTTWQELGDRSEVATAIGNIGNVHYNAGEYEQALDCHKQSLDICTEIGDKRGIARALGNIAADHLNLGDYVRGMDFIQRKLQIVEELSDRSEIANATLVLGNFGAQQENYDEAIEKLIRSLEAFTELGYQLEIALAHGNLGAVYHALGDFPQALHHLRRQQKICGEIGHRIGHGVAVGNIALVDVELQHFEEALRGFDRALAEHREVGYLYGVVSWLSGKADAVLRRSEDGPRTDDAAIMLSDVAKWIDEASELSQQIGHPEMEFMLLVLRARVHCASGQHRQGRKELLDLLRHACNDAQRAELHYWLWKTSANRRSARAEADRVQALRLYELLAATTPKYEYRRRIAELRSGDRSDG